MRTPLPWLGLGTLTLACLPAPAGAQPVGSEFQINTYTTSQQRTLTEGGRHLVAADASGNFVVVWTSFLQDGSSYGVFGQRYDSEGGRLGSEFRVNSHTLGYQWSPSVAAAADGDFIVVWQGYGQDPNYAAIFGQRYDNGGGRLGSEFRVNSYSSATTSAPSVAAAADGDFVVVWAGSYGAGSPDVFGQRYDSAGVPQGVEFRVNTFTTGTQRFPSVASDASGNFVVAWISYNQDGSGPGVFGQRYDSAGVAQGIEFQINSFTPGTQWLPSVASDTGGNFVVVWHSAREGSDYGVSGQRYDSGGAAQGDEFHVNSFTTSDQSFPIVVSDANGNFVVVWDSDTQDGSGNGVFGQRYDSAGVARGSEFRINSYTTSYQTGPTLTATGIDQFVVAWESFGQDGDVMGVFGQRFDFSGGASTIHVGDLDRKAKNVGTSWRAQVKTRVHDGNHDAESGVLVTFNVSGGVGMRTCTTVASGVCEVSVVVGDAVPSLTFTVTNLSKAAFSYVSGDNHDPDPDSNGTTIVVNQP